MTDLLTPFLGDLLHEPWLIRIATVLIFTSLASLLASLVLRHFTRLTRHTENHWDDALAHSARRPAQTAIWLLGTILIGRVLHEHTQEPLLAELDTLRNVGLALCLAWFLFGFISRASAGVAASREARGEAFDRTTLDAVSKLARLVVAVSAVLIVLQALGVSITGVLTLGGIGGIAVGFAAKDILANFFGGLTVYLDRPFSVGDWIRSPDKAIEGTVEHISWRHTRIRAFNKNPIYVPNSLFTTVVVENPSRMSHRRIKETIGLRYDDFARVKPIVDEIRSMLETHPEIDESQTLIVNFNAYGPSSLDLMVYTFTHTRVWIEYHHVKQDVLLKIGEIIAAHGAEIAFPTQTLHIATPGPEDMPA